jgi:prepilin-type N-terminal cleavage/methylation domain-containing protein
VEEVFTRSALSPGRSVRKIAQPTQAGFTKGSFQLVIPFIREYPDEDPRRQRINQSLSQLGAVSPPMNKTSQPTHQVLESGRLFPSGFTLIELLITVAIILILISIATPSYLNMIDRAKVARALAEVRTVADAADQYQMDWGVYPKDHYASWPAAREWEGGLTMLTSPIAYLTVWPLDAFGTQRTINPNLQNVASTYQMGSGSDNTACGGRAHYADKNSLRHAPDCAHAVWISSIGPDRMGTSGWAAFPSGESPDQYPIGILEFAPTNGTRSEGDIFQLRGDWKRPTVQVNYVQS